MRLRTFVRHGLLGIAFSFALLLIGLPAQHASAATCNYTGAVSTNFNTAGNWDCGFVPGASSTAVIPAATSTSLTAGTTLGELLINTNATLTTTGFNLTVQGSATSSGYLIGGSNVIWIGDDLVFLAGFTFTPGTGGTLKMSTTTGAVANAQRFIFPSAVTLGNFDASSTRPIQLIGSALVTVGGNFTLMGAQGTTLTSGATMAVTGTTNVSSTGLLALTDSTNAVTFTATTTNAGTMAITNGAFTFNGDMVNSGTMSESAAQTGTFTFAKDWTNTGTFTSGSSTAVFSGASSQAISSDVNFYNLTGSGSGSKAFSGHVTTTGNLSTSVLFTFNSKILEVFGDVTSTVGMNSLGTVRVSGSHPQSWTGASGYPDITGEFRVNKTAGTAITMYSNNDFLGNIKLLSGTFVASSDNTRMSSGDALIMAGGSFSHNSGTFIFDGGAGTNVAVASTTFNNLSFTPSAYSTYLLSGNTSVSGTTSLDATVSLDLQGNTLTAVGLMTNGGLITLSSGKIVHTAESVKITDSSGTETTSLQNSGSLYVTVQDSNRNLASSTAETMTVTVTGNAAAGADSETLTLTETGVATGIFRNSSAVNVVNSTFASTGNSQFEITGTGVGTTSYTDNQDASDNGSDTVTLTYTAASSGSSSGGGGGVGGGGYIPITITNQVSTQSNASNLTNLQNIGVAVHNLVKLPSDGDASTQYDSAVYYVGSDGKRHAFPNDKVYFTWYTSFDGVQIINQAQLASIPLGSNVTYKPGVKMVKFTTDPKVYVVAKGGVLRWVTTEAAAIELYGAAWNTKIDDINDAFYTNYTFGNNVAGLADYNPMTVQASVNLPSDSLQM